MDESKLQKRQWRASNWQWKALEATRLNQTQTGAIIQAILGNDPMLEHCVIDISRRLFGNELQGFQPPRFVSGGNPGWGATITSDGYVMADFIDKNGQYHVSALVGKVEGLIASLDGLSEFLKLKQRDHEALFRAAREWIKRDYRQKVELK